MRAEYLGVLHNLTWGGGTRFIRLPIQYIQAVRHHHKHFPHRIDSWPLCLPLHAATSSFTLLSYRPKAQFDRTRLRGKTKKSDLHPKINTTPPIYPPPRSQSDNNGAQHETTHSTRSCPTKATALDPSARPRLRAAEHMFRTAHTRTQHTHVKPIFPLTACPETSAACAGTLDGEMRGGGGRKALQTNGNRVKQRQ